MVMDTSPQAQVAVMMGVSSCEVSAAMPNVRAKLAPAVGRQARAADNVQGTCGPGLVARRWGST